MENSLTPRVEIGYGRDSERKVEEKLGIFILLTAFIHQLHRHEHKSGKEFQKQHGDPSHECPTARG